MKTVFAKLGRSPALAKGALALGVGLGIGTIPGWGQSINLTSISLSLDPSTTTLLDNQAGQIVRVLLQNTGASYPVLGGDFFFQIDNGDSSVGSAPSITGVRIAGIAGNPFVSAPGPSQNVDVSTNSTDGEFWTVTFDTTPSGPSVPVNLTGTSLYTFAEVEIDTTGFSTIGQSWDFKIINTTSGDPFFSVEDPLVPLNIIPAYPQASNGTLQIGVAPIPEAAATGAGLGLLGIALLTLATRRARANGSSGPESGAIGLQGCLVPEGGGSVPAAADRG